MRVSRVLPIVAAGALVAATVTPASAETAGVGSTSGALTALGLDVGGLLQLDLLSDNGSATTDPAAGVPSAAAALTALAVEQPTTGLSEAISVFEVESTGEPKTAGQDSAVPIDNAVLKGSVLPTLLGAGVTPDGAVSGVTSGIGQLDVLGGILSLGSSDSDLGTSVLPIAAGGERSLALDAITILDLEALLAGLGIPLTELPTDTILALVDSLGITQLDPVLAQLDAALAQLQPLLDELGLGDFELDELSDLTDLPGVIEDLEGGIDLLSGVQSGSQTVTTTTCELVGGLLGSVLNCTDTVSVVNGATQQVTALAPQLDALTALLDQLLPGLLEDALDLLKGQNLLSLEGLDVSVLTKATDDLATSVADVEAALGAIKVGNLTVPLDGVLDTADQVNAVVAQVQGLVDGVLGTIDLGLADLIDIGLLEEQTSVTQAEDGTIVSKATFNGVRVDVLPIVGELSGVLDGILAGLGGADSIGATLEGLGVPVADPLSVLPLDSALGDLPIPDLTQVVQGTAALELLDGLSLRTASLTQESTYVLGSTVTPGAPAAPASPAGPSLPTTGGNGTMLLLMAGIAAAGALGLRRWVVSQES